MPGVVTKLDEAGRAVIAHHRRCSICQDGSNELCPKADRLWAVVSNATHARVIACVNVHRKKHGGAVGARVLVRKLARVIDILSGKERLPA